jgi:hypothetical protein
MLQQEDDGIMGATPQGAVEKRALRRITHVNSRGMLHKQSHYRQMTKPGREQDRSVALALSGHRPTGRPEAALQLRRCDHPLVQFSLVGCNVGCHG